MQGNGGLKLGGLTVRQACTVLFAALPRLDARALQAALDPSLGQARVEWGQGALGGAPVVAGVAHLPGHKVVMIAMQAPVQGAVLDRTAGVSPMPAETRTELFAHGAAIRLLYVGESSSPLEQLTALYGVAAACVAQGGLGIINERAALAVPAELAEQYLPQLGSYPPPVELWVGAVTFNIDEGLDVVAPRYMMRTYGMEQMVLPDLALIMRDRVQADDTYHVLMNLCLYMVENGEASGPLDEGDRVDFAGRTFLMTEPGEDVQELAGQNRLLLAMEV